MTKFSKDPLKNLKLDQEEKEILEAYEKGEFKSIPLTKQDLKKYQEAARYTLRLMKKNKQISVRINEDVLNKLKIKAVQEGIPYQTLIGSIIYKYVNGATSE